MQQVLHTAYAANLAHALLEESGELRLLDLPAQEDDAVLGVDVDLPFRDVAIAEDDRLHLVDEGRVVELLVRPAPTARALDVAAGVGGDVMDELAARGARRGRRAKARGRASRGGDGVRSAGA